MKRGLGGDHRGPQPGTIRASTKYSGLEYDLVGQSHRPFFDSDSDFS
ncbi:unnamed protein product [Amoebophrya sp. A25]|nr:unnamed protein product [Amoebophrya sp. A25]|eukprot:GSA25T00006578001.1